MGSASPSLDRGEKQSENQTKTMNHYNWLKAVVSKLHKQIRMLVCPQLPSPPKGFPGETIKTQREPPIKAS